VKQGLGKGMCVKGSEISSKSSTEELKVKTHMRGRYTDEKILLKWFLK
jgi:hypothetical protein